jgi:SAM-dependent methyltransferase
MNPEDVAADGSPVELYARMPTFGEPELVHATIPAGTNILELGAGAGRMTHRLLELGHPMTAVDSSAAMLARIVGADRVHAQIEDLDLGRTFGCVLLASQLVNIDDDVQRAAFLATARRHLDEDGGVLLIQRYDPGWADDPSPSESRHDGVIIRVLSPRREGERLMATVEYEVDGRQWRHGPFTSRILSDDELLGRLFVAGLAFDRWLDERRTWLAAVPTPDVSALYVAFDEAEQVVGELRRRWDSAGLAVAAHVTILFPFLEPNSIDAAVEASLAEIAGTVRAFEVEFARVGRFPDVVWLAPDPAMPFARLTDAVAARWPDHPPYGGAFEQVVHHLTVADGAPRSVLDHLESSLPGSLPVRARVGQVTLSVRERGTWSVRQQYALPGGVS